VERAAARALVRMLKGLDRVGCASWRMRGVGNGGMINVELCGFFWLEG
jgi:hypothetical protein